MVPVKFLVEENAEKEDTATTLKPFALALLTGNSPKPVEPQNPDSPRADRVFGQVNRLFPLKLACRWVAASASKASEVAVLVPVGQFTQR